jgi:hypothetical protein
VQRPTMPVPPRTRTVCATSDLSESALQRMAGHVAARDHAAASLPHPSDEVRLLLVTNSSRSDDRAGLQWQSGPHVLHRLGRRAPFGTLGLVALHGRPKRAGGRSPRPAHSWRTGHQDHRHGRGAAAKTRRPKVPEARDGLTAGPRRAYLTIRPSRWQAGLPRPGQHRCVKQIIRRGRGAGLRRPLQGPTENACDRFAPRLVCGFEQHGSAASTWSRRPQVDSLRS